MALMGRKYITSTVAEKLVQATGRDYSRPPHEYLSDREFAVMKLLAVGKSISDIANSMNLGLTTISTYRTRVLHKLDMKSNAELTVYCLENKLI